MQRTTCHNFFNIYLQDVDTQFFVTRWGQAPSTASEVPPENVLEGLYKLKIRGSVQIQTEVAVNDHEMDRDRAVPSNQKLKTMARRHIDQMVRTRNFKARNARFETSVLGKSQKGESQR